MLFAFLLFRFFAVRVSSWSYGQCQLNRESQSFGGQLVLKLEEKKEEEVKTKRNRGKL